MFLVLCLKNERDMKYLIAIDGGGSNCRAAVATADGAVLGKAIAGAANIATDPLDSAANIVEAAKLALKQAGLENVPLDTIPAYLGLAGFNVGTDTSAVAARLPFEQVHFEDDAVIALQGALGDADGVIAILGTGSVYYGRQGTTIRRAGGWGFTVGDLGGGARLGQALLQETLLAHDNVRPSTRLTQQVMTEFGGDAVRLYSYAQKSKPSDFARFAPLVFEHAERGDAVGTALVRDAVTHVNAALAAVTWPECEALCLLGGLAPFYAPRIDAKFRAILRAARADALTGAIELGLHEFARSTAKG
jgi:glucosamine kinase